MCNSEFDTQYTDSILHVFVMRHFLLVDPPNYWKFIIWSDL